MHPAWRRMTGLKRGDVVLVASSNVYLVGTNGVIRWTAALPGGGNGGPPTVADFDNDGAPEVGVAGQGGFGAMQSGALERSNVELTDELIALVATQRNFSANAKAIQTMSDMEKNLADQA